MREAWNLIQSNYFHLFMMILNTARIKHLKVSCFSFNVPIMWKSLWNDDPSLLWNDLHPLYEMIHPFCWMIQLYGIWTDPSFMKWSTPLWNDFPVLVTVSPRFVSLFLLLFLLCCNGKSDWITIKPLVSSESYQPAKYMQLIRTIYIAGQCNRLSKPWKQG